MYSFILFLPFLSSLLLLLFGNFLGVKGSIFLNKFFNFFLFFFINLIYYEIMYKGLTIELNLNFWFYTELFYTNISLLFDSISIHIVYLIILIYIIAINYSYWYLNQDPHLIRFIISMSFFSLMMILLVLSKNLIIMFIGWEGVGITSYLLINFWYSRLQANKASIKAILFNKVGDIFFLFSLLLFLIFNYQLFSFDNFYLINSSLFILLGFLIASIAKSAQFGLHSWLGDAMEGPTPVSALLHAATMVTAGIYLFLRILPSFSLPYSFFLFIGLFTILLGGFISLFQFDIKKIIAFSTCSQLGYMFYSSSLGLYNFSYFHLIVHGFFKALLFLTAGILIHSFNNQQDLRKFGSLLFFSPFSYIFFFIGTLSIISFPFSSGFFSKDFILLYSYFSYSFIYFFALFGVLLTVSYSFRLFFNLFFSFPKSKSSPHSEPFFSSFLFLIFGSLFFAYFFKDFFLSINFSLFPLFSFDFEFLPFYIKFLPILLSFLGILLASFLDSFVFFFPLNIFISYFLPVFTFFNKKFFFDPIFSNKLSYLFLSFSYSSFFKLLDRGLFELFSSLGLYRSLYSFYPFSSFPLSKFHSFSSNNSSSFHSNYFYYIFFILFILFFLYFL